MIYFHVDSSSTARPILLLKISRKNLTIRIEGNKVWSWRKDGESTFWIPKQLYTFMRCRIVKEGSELNIEIHKESQRRRIITFGRAPEGDLVCSARIKFDVLWKHLVLESRKETKCEFILVSIAYDMLKIPQQTSQWNLWIQCQDFSSGSSLRYAFDSCQYVDSLSKYNCRHTTAIYGLLMHKSGVQ